MFIHPSNHCIYCSIGRKTTCHGERPCASWPSLASRLLHPYRVRNDKSRVASVQTSCHRECSVNCHGEESFKTTRPSCFCHYERSEVIKKTSVACEEIASVTTFHRNDKEFEQEPCRSRLPRRAFCTSRNDKNR
jgi:hypothetical protein